MRERDLDELRSKYRKSADLKMPEDVKSKIYNMISNQAEVEITASTSVRSTRPKRYWATTGAAVAAVLIVVAGISVLQHQRPQSTVQDKASQNYKIPASAPAVVKNIEPSQIQTVSIDGWGPGADGNSISFVYNPYGNNRAAALLQALQYGKQVSNKDASQIISQGGEAWAVLHLADGHTLVVERALTVHHTGSSSAEAMFWVSLDNKPSNGAFIEDTTGHVQQAYVQLFQGSSLVLNQRPSWLTSLSDGEILTAYLAGNNNDTWYQHELSQSDVTLSHLVSALTGASIVDPSTIDASKILGFRSHWRTNSMLLGLQLKDGSTLYISGPYAQMTRGSASTTTAPDIFRVTYSSSDSMSSVFIEDKSGTMVSYWNQQKLNE